MSTLTEVQDAAIRLSDDEKKALAVWLNSQTTPELTAEDEQRLLRSLDQAMGAIDAGKGVPIEEVRKLARSWAAIGTARAASLN